MIYSYTNSDQEGTIRLIKGESELSRNYYKQQVGDTFHSIAWNIGKLNINSSQILFFHSH